MDAYEYLDPFRDAIEAMEALRDAGRLPAPGTPFWFVWRDYAERARALWDSGPVLVELDPRTGQARSPLTDALAASLLFSQPFMPGDDVEGAAV
jgi:hypothetical protein